MRRTEALQGVRMIGFRSVLGRYEADELNQIEAAELLGISERTFRRWCQRFEEGGEAGLLDRRLGKASGKRVPLDREEEVEALYRTRYNGFTAQHFHEQLVRHHRFNWGYTWTKAFLQSKGFLERAPRRGAHRRKRPRRPLPGMMLHQDGSRHEWLAGQDAMGLIVTMDDATSTIYSAFLTPEEGTASTFRALSEVFTAHGLPLSLYTDRGSHYFFTPEADGPIDRKPRPRSAGRWPTWAWNTSRLIPHRRAADRSGCSRRYRTVWSKNWPWPGSRRLKKPMRSSAMFTYPCTMPGFR